jgi:integrase
VGKRAGAISDEQLMGYERNNLSWLVLFQEYLEVKKANNRKATSMKQYEKMICPFLRLLPSDQANEEEITKAAFQYLNRPRKDGAALSNDTFNNRLTYLRTFFRWCQTKKGVFYDEKTGFPKALPLSDITKRHIDKRPKHQNAKTLIALLSLCDQRRVSGLRDYALILLQLDTGIRPSEALNLSTNDVHWEKPTPYIDVPAEVSKTGRWRPLPLNPTVIKALKRYLKLRPKEKMYSEKLAIKITPYQLRHSAAVSSIRNGANAFKVQSLLGHTTMNMTLRYVNLEKSDILEESKTWSPVENMKDGQ